VCDRIGKKLTIVCLCTINQIGGKNSNVNNIFCMVSWGDSHVGVCVWACEPARTKVEYNF
jgi:hypothetical protein